LRICIRERRNLRVEISGVRQNKRFVIWLAATRTALFFRLVYGMHMAVVTEPVL
jgi:hypothetical protein